MQETLAVSRVRYFWSFIFDVLIAPASLLHTLFQTGQQQQQQPPQPHYPPPPPRAVPTQEYQQTATIRNQVNLKKHTLRLEATADPQVLAITFTFDASASCR